MPCNLSRHYHLDLSKSVSGIFRYTDLIKPNESIPAVWQMPLKYPVWPMCLKPRRQKCN